MRLGWDGTSINAPELAARAEAAGVRLVTVHGRTRCQFYDGAADWAAIVQQDLKSIGVELKTQILEWATFQERNRKHEFQASTAAWGTGTDPDTLWNIWHSEEYKAGRNYGGFKNARVDELFALARHEFDPEKRRTHYQEIQKIVYDEQPYTFLWNTPTLWAFSKRIRGVIYSPRGVWNFDPSFMAWWVPRGEQAYGSK